jgi:hypothetical protein
MKSKRMRYEGHTAHMGEMKNIYNILVREHEGK